MQHARGQTAHLSHNEAHAPSLTVTRWAWNDLTTVHRQQVHAVGAVAAGDTAQGSGRHRMVCELALDGRQEGGQHLALVLRLLGLLRPCAGCVPRHHGQAWAGMQ
jgi:hypothetical protein